MNSFRKSIGFVLLTLVFITSVTSSASALPRTQDKPNPQLVASLGKLVEQSGYAYRKAADDIWVVSIKGKSLVDIQLLITSTENLIIMGVVVAKKDSMKVTPEMTFKLLRLVHNIDRVKIGFDDDEDLFIRAEVTAKCFDAEEFKANIDQLAAGADKVHESIKAYLR